MINFKRGPINTEILSPKEGITENIPIESKESPKQMVPISLSISIATMYDRIPTKTAANHFTTLEVYQIYL